MKDINLLAEEDLKKTGYNIVFQYPKSFTSLPAVSFYTVNESGSFACDNEENMQDGRIAVDIWASSPLQCGDMAIKINSVMSDAGWTRCFSRDVPDDGDIYHRTMQFIKTIY